MKKIATIATSATSGKASVAVPHKQYGEVLNRGKKDEVTEEDVLRWSREARELKKAGKLPVLHSLKELR